MPCPNCGHQNPPESLFCGSCGTALGAAGGAAAEQDATVVDTFSESGPPTAAPPTAGAQPWGTEVNEAVPPAQPAATWQEPDPTTAMPPTTAVPAAAAVAAAGATGAVAATGATPGGPTGPPPGGPVDPDDDDRSNRGWIIAIVVLVLLLIAAVVAFFLTRDSGTSTTSTTVPTTTSSTTTSSTSTTSTSTTSTSTTTSTTRPSTTTTTAPTTTTTAPTTTTTTAPKPTITSFTVPSTVSEAQCSSGTATLTLSWVTANTKSVTIGISNPQPFQQDLPSSGSIQVPFNCGNGTVTYYITAFGNDGTTAVQSKEATYTPPSP